MILDTLSLWQRYAATHPRLSRAFVYLEQLSPHPAVGRHDIEGDSLFALVQRYTTRPVASPQLEAHRRYIDIQFLAAGSELIHWAPLAALSEVVMPYDATKEAALFACSDETVPLRLRGGQFAIFFPDDAHAPCCAWNEPEDVLKVVVKVAV